MSSSEASNGLVSYILTYSQTLSCESLETKCKDSKCTSIICGVVKQLVVMQDPEGVSALSVDPALSTANYMALFDINKLNIEIQGSIGWDSAPDTISAVCHLRRYSQLPLVPNSHPSNAPIPTLNHLANTCIHQQDIDAQ